jgi:hypothetical protein
MLLMIALPHRAAPLTVRCLLPTPIREAVRNIQAGPGFVLPQADCAVRAAGIREGHLTACAAISFKHHKELFSETLPRNLP